MKNLARRPFRPILKAAKLPRIRDYDLRHTHVAQLLYARVPVQSVSKWVRHANPTITMKVYAHVLDEIDQDPLKLFEKYLGRETKRRWGGRSTADGSGATRPSIQDASAIPGPPWHSKRGRSVSLTVHQWAGVPGGKRLAYSVEELGWHEWLF